MPALSPELAVRGEPRAGGTGSLARRCTMTSAVGMPCEGRSPMIWGAWRRGTSEGVGVGVGGVEGGVEGEGEGEGGGEGVGEHVGEGDR